MSDYNTEIRKEQERIEKHLNSIDNLRHMYEPVHVDGLIVEIQVDGDWHHQHVCCDVAMKQIGYSYVGKRIVESHDDEDFVAIHSYLKGDEDFVRACREMFAPAK